MHLSEAKVSLIISELEHKNKIEKIKKGYDKNIIVLGEDHKLYFQQLKAALSLIKYKAPEPIHHSFVLIQEQDKRGKM